MPGNGMVQVAFLHSDSVSYSWHESLRRMYEHDRVNAQRLVPTPLETFASVGELVAARNYLTKLFLDHSDHEWLLFVDTDMGFRPDTVDRLVGAADPGERPVVGALCFALCFQGHDGMGGMRVQIVPTLYKVGKQANTGHDTFTYFGDYPADSIVPVAATGAACLLMHRTALEAVRARHGDHWWDQVIAPSGTTVGEDLCFCLRLQGLGIKVHVHTGVPTSHHKRVWLSEYEYTRSIGAPDIEDLAPPVPPATDKVAIVVPVMKRPENAEPFMTSLRASTGLAKVYAVCDYDDAETIDAWKAAGAETIVRLSQSRQPGSFAAKVNEGYQWTAETAEPWLFLVGDDVRFHPGWLDRAQYVATRTGAHVVGTNDLGTERVRTGEHATHLLIRRSYVDGQGASWGGPGVVAHEGYRHWYVDDEIVTVAKQRGVWAMALDSIVEHLHPMFGKGADDGVYQLGRSHAEADAELFEKRLAEQVTA